jgi:hypothetical protein
MKTSAKNMPNDTFEVDLTRSKEVLSIMSPRSPGNESRKAPARQVVDLLARPLALTTARIIPPVRAAHNPSRSREMAASGGKAVRTLLDAKVGFLAQSSRMRFSASGPI